MSNSDEVRCILCESIIDENKIEHDIAICPNCARDSLNAQNDSENNGSVTTGTSTRGDDEGSACASLPAHTNAKEVSDSTAYEKKPKEEVKCILCESSFNSDECTHELQICPNCTRDSEYASDQQSATAVIRTTQDQRLDSSPINERSTLQLPSVPAVRDDHSDDNDERGNRVTDAEFPDGVYSGIIDLDGLPHGEGKMVFIDGTTYSGEWCHSIMHGFGELTTCNGIDKLSYKGDWIEGKPHGQGIYKYDNGDVYQGCFANGLMEGKGLYTYANKEVYDGEWKKGKQHGRGKHSYKSGNVYEGRFRNGWKSGNGAFIYANGDRFYGAFKKDKKEGLGAYIKESGILEIKQYVDGDPINGVRFNQNRDKAWSIVDGQFQNMRLNDAEKYLRETRLQSPFLANYLW